VQKLIAAVLAVPMILIISVAVFQSMAFQSRSPFEQAVTNELLGVVSASPSIFNTAYPAKEGSAAVTVKNVTSGAVISGASATINYKSGLDPAVVTVSSPTVGSDIKAYINYTAYSGEGYSEWTRTYRGTLSGMNLGSLLPFIYIAIAVVGVILGAFGVAAVLRR